MNKAAKTIGATVGSATLLGAAMMAAAPMPFVSNEDYGLEEASLETTSAVTESIKEVRGAFAFDQTTTVAIRFHSWRCSTRQPRRFARPCPNTPWTRKDGRCA